jgi:hypothetical protein
MAQHDYVIANQTFPSYRNDHNNSLSAVVSKNSGTSEPSTTYAYQWWYDSTNDILKIRNADNDAWINFASFDQSNDNFSLTVQDLTVNGTGVIPSGTKMLFQQTSAPTGFTKLTTHNNKALRVVSGTASTGGTNSFTNAFNSSKTVSGTTGTSSVTISGTTASHTLTVDQIPSHTHTHPGWTMSEGIRHQDGTDRIPQRGDQGTQSGTFTFSSTGGSSGHTHNISVTSGSHSHSFSDSFNLDVQYVDLIIAQKD